MFMKDMVHGSVLFNADHIQSIYKLVNKGSCGELL